MCLLGLAFAASAHGQSFDSIADTYTRSNATTSNFGADTVIRVQPWGDMQGFVRFDLSPIAGADATTAVLALRVDDVKTSGAVHVHRVLGPWQEQTLTRTSQPALGPAVATILLSPADNGREVTVDVTGLVDQFLASPAADHGLALTQDGANAWFRTRESGPAPQLRITTAGGGPNAAPQVSAGPDLSIPLGSPATLNGAVSDDGKPNPPGHVVTSWTKVAGPGAVSFANAAATSTSASFSAAGSYVLRLTANDGAIAASDDLVVDVTAGGSTRTLDVTADSYTKNNATSSNFGVDTVVRVQPFADMTGFIHFELSSLAGASVSNAVLRLPVDDVKDGGTVRIHRILGPWSETTLTHANRPAIGAVIASFPVAPANNGQEIAVDVTSIVNDLLASPSTNFGLALTQSSANVWFDSRESGNPIRLVATTQGGPVNAAPQVDAGPDKNIVLPAAASLAGSATDDGRPNPPGTLTLAWSKVSGPGTVAFGNAGQAETQATFGQPGTYVLRLSASDGELQASDTVNVTVQAAPVNQAPTVSAGPDFSATVNVSTVTQGSVSDDGLPNPPGTLGVQWSVVSGPGSVSFTGPGSAITGVSFSQSGSYVLRLRADDGQFVVTDDVAVSVTAGGVPQTLGAVADTYTRSNAVNSNFGAETLVRVQPWGDMTGFVRFDLSGVPGGTVSSATLRMRVDTIGSAGTLRVHRVLGNWAELSLTRTTQPPLGPAEQSFAIVAANAGQTIAVDVTAIVNAMLANPSGNFGFALSQAGANAWFRSRESGTPMQLSVTPGPPPAAAFTDITAPSGTAGPASFGGHGVQFADVTGDGWSDFYVTMNLDSFADVPELFYRNLDGSDFSEEAAARGIDNLDSGSHGGVFADFDNDGDFDLYNGSYEQNRLYRNDGSGQFTDITVAAGFPAREWLTRGVAAVDMDGDGDLDIVAITGFKGSGDPVSERNEIYRNNGNGTFTALSLEPVFSAPAGQGITDADYDNDGDMDLFAANRTGDVVILRNVAGTGFEIVAPANIGITHIAGDGISFADINNDGHLDVLLDDRLYLADGDGTFTFRAALSGPAVPYMGGFADLDNDGDQDIVFPGANHVYYNDGLGSFSAGPTFALGAVNDPRSVAFADIDNDGDVDFFFAQKDTANILVRNNYSGTNRWLQVRLRGANGQAGAFGARVYVYRAGQLNSPSALVSWREAHSQSGYLAQDDPRLTLGTGAPSHVDVKVVFPGGATTTLLNVATNQAIEVAE